MIAAIRSNIRSSRVLRRAGQALILSCCFAAVACEQSGSDSKSADRAANDKGSAKTTTTITAPATPAKMAVKTAVAKNGAAATPSAGKAVIGKPAPNFTLLDIDGKEVSLSQFRGSTVVLEWFNPDCPFVKASHGPGSLNGLAKKNSKDTVWLAINSGGKGKQGAGTETNRKGLASFAMTHPLLIDESGSVGKLYGAERTPHMYVVDPKGVLVYKGAIDNSPDGEGKSPAGGTLVNYIDGALTAIREGKPVTPAETKAYGCGVKYGES